jgi:pimeloyl-ACP methyl ester carboxylesterase
MRSQGFLLVAMLGLVSAAAAESRTVSEVLTEPVFHGQVQYYEDGPKHAPTVVLVHGLGDKAAHDWNSLTRVLSREFRVVRFDLPGFGRSSKGNASYTPDNYASLVRYLAERRIRTEPFLLVGHSMGGAIALRYAARYPQSVSGLVLIDVPGILHRSVYSQHLARQGLGSKVPGLSMAPNDPLGNLLGNAFSSVERKQLMPELVLQFPQIRQKMLNGEPAKIAGLALALEDFTRDITAVKNPTLVLWGERDTVAPLRTGRLLAAVLPQSQLTVFEGSGHVPMDDVAEQFNKTVLDFLRNPQVNHVNSILRTPLTPVQNNRVAQCRDRDGMTFEGEYEQIKIIGCRNVVLRRARVHKLRLINSDVSIEDSRIGGGTGGLVADDARVIITGSRIEGKVAITVIEAKLDIAGSRIIGEEAAIAARYTSEVVFSVSRVESPYNFGELHGFRVVTAKDSL